MPECIQEPMNCTMVKSQDVSGTHKEKDSCFAQCLDGFMPATFPVLKSNYYCPRLAPINFDVLAGNFKIS